MRAPGSDAIRGLAKGEFADDIVADKGEPIDEVDHGGVGIRTG